jgi:hypothetical protein
MVAKHTYKFNAKDGEIITYQEFFKRFFSQQFSEKQLKQLKKLEDYYLVNKYIETDFNEDGSLKNDNDELFNLVSDIRNAVQVKTSRISADELESEIDKKLKNDAQKMVKSYIASIKDLIDMNYAFEFMMLFPHDSDDRGTKQKLSDKIYIGKKPIQIFDGYLVDANKHDIYIPDDCDCCS